MNQNVTASASGSTPKSAAAKEPTEPMSLIDSGSVISPALPSPRSSTDVANVRTHGALHGERPDMRTVDGNHLAPAPEVQAATNKRKFDEITGGEKIDAMLAETKVEDTAQGRERDITLHGNQCGTQNSHGEATRIEDVNTETNHPQDGDTNKSGNKKQKSSRRKTQNTMSLKQASGLLFTIKHRALKDALLPSDDEDGLEAMSGYEKSDIIPTQKFSMLLDRDDQVILTPGIQKSVHAAICQRKFLHDHKKKIGPKVSREQLAGARAAYKEATKALHSALFPKVTEQDGQKVWDLIEKVVGIREVKPSSNEQASEDPKSSS